MQGGLGRARPSYGEMGHGAELVREGEARRGNKSRLVAGNWAQTSKGIYKRVSTFQNLSFK
jgi:hypothetical protein